MTMQGFIILLFEGADVDDKRGVDQLNDDLRNMAKRSGIEGVKFLAEVSVGHVNEYSCAPLERECC